MTYTNLISAFKNYLSTCPWTATIASGETPPAIKVGMRNSTEENSILIIQPRVGSSQPMAGQNRKQFLSVNFICGVPFQDGTDLLGNDLAENNTMKILALSDDISNLLLNNPQPGGSLTIKNVDYEFVELALKNKISKSFRSVIFTIQIEDFILK